MWIKALNFKRKMSNNSKILIKHNNAIQENWKLKNRGEERRKHELSECLVMLYGYMCGIWCRQSGWKSTGGQVYVHWSDGDERLREGGCFNSHIVKSLINMNYIVFKVAISGDMWHGEAAEHGAAADRRRCTALCGSVVVPDVGGGVRGDSWSLSSSVP